MQNELSSKSEYDVLEHENNLKLAYEVIVKKLSFLNNSIDIIDSKIAVVVGFIATIMSATVLLPDFEYNTLSLISIALLATAFVLGIAAYFPKPIPDAPSMNDIYNKYYLQETYINNLDQIVCDLKGTYKDTSDLNKKKS